MSWLPEIKMALCSVDKEEKGNGDSKNKRKTKPEEGENMASSYDAFKEKVGEKKD